jgi:release factor glutamine methyltransferase
MTRSQALALATERLAHLPDSAGEAMQLLMQVDGFDRVQWMLAPDAEINSLERFQQCLERRSQGESLASIRGSAGFLDYDLAVGPGVLIPRPDTETFVQIKWGPGPVVDLGTGSGALARWALDAQASPVFAIEKSLQALSYARRNLPLAVTLLRGDWASMLADQSMGTILSNPPYIEAAEPELSGDGVRCEPRQALVADDSGYSDLKTLIEQGRRVLKPGGYLWMEHGHQQAARVREALRQAGYGAVETLVDLPGKERISGGCWHG